MTLRAGNVFYFPFSRTDQALIDETTVQATDVDYSAAPQSGVPYPQSLKLAFNLKDPAQPPQVRPIAPGQMTFLYDPASGTPPNAWRDCVSSNYSNWSTIGTILVHMSNPELWGRFNEISHLPTSANYYWYSKVKLTQPFLFTGLGQLPRQRIPQENAPSIPTSSSDWIKHAIFGFLRGKYSPSLELGAQQSADSVATVEMPRSVTTTAGANSVELIITTALNYFPADGEDTEFEYLGTLTDVDPAHPANGCFPARLIYQSLRTGEPGTLGSGTMIDADAGLPIPDKVLNSDPRYLPIRCTRIWEPKDDFSVHFPSQVLHVAHDPPASDSFDQRLPAHGILYIKQTQVQSLGGSSYTISVSNPGADPRHEMYWLKATGITEAWKVGADNTPVTVDFSQSPIHHIILRRRMSQEVIYDKGARPTTTGEACTYFSMRRAIRALVNNRIAGGRLNFEVYYVKVGQTTRLAGGHRTNKATTVGIIQRALGTDAWRVLHKNPDKDGIIENMAKSLLPVWEKFFPDDVSTPNYPLGKVVYYIWQSGWGEFQAFRRNYLQDWRGGGGAGAILGANLSDQYTINPGQNPPGPVLNNDDYATLIVNEIFNAVLDPGAPLQFWDKLDDLSAIRNLTNTTDLPGHSPIFLRYSNSNEPRGIYVLDQYGESFCRVVPSPVSSTNSRLKWYTFKPEAWLASEWRE